VTYSFTTFGPETPSDIDAFLRDRWAPPCVDVSRAGLHDLTPPTDTHTIAARVRAALGRQAVMWASPRIPTGSPRTRA